MCTHWQVREEGGREKKEEGQERGIMGNRGLDK